MATTFFPVDSPGNGPNGATWTQVPVKKMLNLRRGSAAITNTQNTIATLSANSAAGSAVHPWGSTTSTLILAGGSDWPTGTLVFYSNPLQPITISGAITANSRGSESNAMANYTLGASIWKVTPNGAFTNFARADSVTEVGTTEGSLALTATVASQAFARGDRIAIIMNWIGVGTSASGFTASGFYNGPTASASGDISFTFTETIVELHTANSAVNFSDPAMLMEGTQQSKRNHLWLPKKLWRPKLWKPGGELCPT